MKKLGNFFNKTEEWILIVLMSALAVVVFIQVLWRVFGLPLSWSDELSRYLAIWVTFIGASYGFRFGAHIGVEAFKSWLPFRVRRVIDTVCNLIVIFISSLMMWYGVSIIVNVHMKFAQVSPAMRMPIWIAYLAIPVGYLFMIFRNVSLTVDSVRDIIKGEKKTDETEKIEGGNA